MPFTFSLIFNVALTLSFLGDNKWFNESLTLDDLLRYRAILLPNTGYLTNKEEEVKKLTAI
ncbi:MAG: hypothetical protein ACTSR0_02255 [Candidatus Asgardarchaeia archaeon]